MVLNRLRVNFALIGGVGSVAVMGFERRVRCRKSVKNPSLLADMGVGIVSSDGMVFFIFLVLRLHWDGVCFSA